MDNIIVCKFGGSSVANSGQIKKVYDIIKEDKDRKIVVVSAPKGITDGLIACAKHYYASKEFPHDEFKKIENIYHEIGKNLDAEKIVEDVLEELKVRITSGISNKNQYEDLVKAWGEYSNAKVIAEYFNKAGTPSVFMSPDDVGLNVTEDFGNAKVLKETYRNIKKALKDESRVVLFPGFYGKTKNGKTATFSRGGSDLTGSIMAAGVIARVYENWTDQDGIRKADPRIVENPKKIEEITYKEIRELAYMGFKVFHAEAMIPAMKHNIPINIKNTNNPKDVGTFIVNDRETRNDEPIIGVASRNNFCIFNVEKILMDQQVGFGRRLLGIFEENGLSYEHTPSGIDSISVILDQTQLDEDTEKEIIEKIKETLNPDSISLEKDKCLISVVGLGLKRTPGIASEITDALAKAKINIEILNMGASEISLILGVAGKDSKKAVKAIYDEFY